MQFNSAGNGAKSISVDKTFKEGSQNLENKVNRDFAGFYVLFHCPVKETLLTSQATLTFIQNPTCG